MSTKQRKVSSIPLNIEHAMPVIYTTMLTMAATPCKYVLTKNRHGQAMVNYLAVTSTLEHAPQLH